MPWAWQSDVLMLRHFTPPTDNTDPCPCPNLASLRLRCSLVCNKGVHALGSLLLLPHTNFLPAMREVR